MSIGWPPSFYRYVGRKERASIRRTNTIVSLSGVTYYALDPPSLYETWDDVREPGRSEPEADLGCSAVARYGRAPSGTTVPPRTDPVTK
jgi:hypothetical protein